jgi:HEAT repeat protein
VGGENARQALLEAARHESARTRAAAIRGLGHLDATPAAVHGLREATNDSDPWVRYYACQALGNVGDADATELLAARAQDGAGQVRVAAIEAIAKLKTPAALQVLARAAADDDAELRRAALAGIGSTRQPTLLPLLLDASYAPEIATRLVAVSGLANFDEAAALSRVCEVAQGDPEASVRHAAIELLSENQAPTATAALIALLSDSVYQGRAVSALASGAAARTRQLVAALAQAPTDVAEALVTVLTTLPSAASEPLLLAALGGPNEHARRAAVRALRFAFDSEATSLALTRAAHQDSDPEVRRVAAARLP